LGIVCGADSGYLIASIQEDMEGGKNGHTEPGGEIGAVLSERILETGMVARKNTDYCDTDFARDNSAQDDKSDK
jgi:hypothetical protein